jgi:hypothetical protein
MRPGRPDLNNDTSIESSPDLRSIFARVKVGQVASGVLYYEVRDIDRSAELVKVLHAKGFQVSLVTDVYIKDLLPVPHYRPADKSTVLRIEWEASTVERLWPSLKVYPTSVLESHSLKGAVSTISALATLVFILLSFVGLLVTDDKVVATAFLGCGLGCFLLLCLLLFVDSDADD